MNAGSNVFDISFDDHCTNAIKICKYFNKVDLEKNQRVYLTHKNGITDGWRFEIEFEGQAYEYLLNSADSTFRLLPLESLIIEALTEACHIVAKESSTCDYLKKAEEGYFVDFGVVDHIDYWIEKYDDSCKAKGPTTGQITKYRPLEKIEFLKYSHGSYNCIDLSEEPHTSNPVNPTN